MDPAIETPTLPTRPCTIMLAMEGRLTPTEKQVELLAPMLDYCDVMELVIRCGSPQEASDVGRLASDGLLGRLRFEVDGPVLRFVYVPPHER